jgi:hypothetical protein
MDSPTTAVARALAALASSSALEAKRIAMMVFCGGERSGKVRSVRQTRELKADS